MIKRIDYFEKAQNFNSNIEHILKNSYDETINKKADIFLLDGNMWNCNVGQVVKICRKTGIKQILITHSDYASIAVLNEIEKYGCKLLGIGKTDAYDGNTNTYNELLGFKIRIN